jgi:hypothetical protein
MIGARLYGDILSNYVKAGSQSCSPELLEAMAHSEIDRIRLRVAENPRTPIDVLGLLAKDKNADVRIAVGSNPSTPPYVSYRLAFDEDPNVRFGLADDINTPIELLDKLCDDANPYVSNRAAKTKEIALAQGKAKSFGSTRFFKWAGKGLSQPNLRYA